MMNFDYSMASAYAAVPPAGSNGASGANTPPSNPTGSGASMGYSANGSSAGSTALMAAAGSPPPGISTAASATTTPAHARRPSYYANIATGSLAYKEYLFHSSSSINIEVRLEFYLVVKYTVRNYCACEYFIDVYTNQYIPHQQLNVALKRIELPISMCLDANLTGSSSIGPYKEVFVEAWLMCNQVPAHSFPIR
jgi:hypothetical protein